MTPTEIKINEAKNLVCTRYNETKRSFDVMLRLDDVTTLTAIVEPHLLRMVFKVNTKAKLLYEVVYNNKLHEYYVNTYKKIEQFDYRKEG